MPEQLTPAQKRLWWLSICDISGGVLASTAHDATDALALERSGVWLRSNHGWDVSRRGWEVSLD